MEARLPKIICGGQTGVDTAALEFAEEAGAAHGGWVPRGRSNEAGRIAERFTGLVEADDSLPETRTRLNVLSAQATLVLTDGSDSPGTETTVRSAREGCRPLRIVDLGVHVAEEAVATRAWIESVNPSTLNVAGPRESEAPGIRQKAKEFLRMIFLAGQEF